MAEGQHGTLYTLAFAGAVCLVCAVAVAGTAVGLKGRQRDNALLFQQRTILAAAGLLAPGADDGAVERVFAEQVEPLVIDRATGEPVEDQDYERWLATRRAMTEVPRNPAGVLMVPEQVAIFQVLADDGTVDQYVLRIHGKGLWSTMRAFLALDADGRTIRGVSFYEHGETPGLGGEIENPAWDATWRGVRAVDAEGQPVFRVVKGGGGPDDPTAVEALSGATLTSQGVQAMVRFWLDDNGYGPFLERVRAGALARGGGDG